MKNCSICEHTQREKIEWALFKVTPEGSSLTLEKIAEEFEVSVEDLRRHMLFHTPFGDEGNDSIIRQIKMREADLLGEAAQEYVGTMKLLGRQIRGYMSDEGPKRMIDKMLGKPQVDLYLGCGENLQKTVKTIADINNLLNGPKDDGLSGLQALAAAINSSRQQAGEQCD